MSNSLWFSRIFTLQSFSWSCFNYSFWLFHRCIWKDYYQSEEFFYNHWIWKFSKFQFFSFPFFKFIDFKITTNSFKYSLVEHFLKPIFSKVVTGGIFFEKFSQFFRVYIPSLPGVWGYTIRATKVELGLSKIKLAIWEGFLIKYYKQNYWPVV